MADAVWIGCAECEHRWGSWLELALDHLRHGRDGWPRLWRTVCPRCLHDL